MGCSHRHPAHVVADEHHGGRWVCKGHGAKDGEAAYRKAVCGRAAQLHDDAPPWLQAGDVDAGQGPGTGLRVKKDLNQAVAADLDGLGLGEKDPGALSAGKWSVMT